MSAEPPRRTAASEDDRRALAQAIGEAQRKILDRLGNIARARLVYDARRHRDRVFGAGIFDEPAFDILLDLYLSHPEGRDIAECCANITRVVPENTARRYIAHLKNVGLVTCAPGSGAVAVPRCALTKEGHKKLELYLSDLI